MTDLTGQLVEGRSCNGCTMCCKVMGVKALDKPSMQWCSHCTPGKGCKIYADRPTECAAFHCDYLRRPELDQRWYPAQCKLVLAYRPAINAMAIYADPSRKDNWRKEPYYSQFKAWARYLYPMHGQVIVYEGDDVFAVMPDRDKHLGRGRQGQRVSVFEKKTPQGMIYEAVLLDEDATIESAMATLPK